MSEYLTVSGRMHTGLPRPNNGDALIAADLSRSSSISDNFSWHRWEIGQNGSLLAIADGMRVANGRRVASKMSVHLLCEYLETKDKPVDAVALREAIVFSSKSVYAKADADAELTGMAATMTALVLQNGSALIGHIGDTRAYLFRGDEITCLTGDQSQVQGLVDAGVPRAVGQTGKVDPEIVTIDLEPDDQLLLCTDGLTALMKEFEIKNTLKLMLTMEEKCERFMAIANERGGGDNVSVIAARYIRDDFGEITGELPATKKFRRELF